MLLNESKIYVCVSVQDMFAASLEAPASADPRRGRKWYFERLEVQTIKSNVTLIPRPGNRDTESASTPGRIRMAATLGINFIDINNVPLKINALAFQNALLSPSILMSHITRHLINSVSNVLLPTSYWQVIVWCCSLCTLSQVVQLVTLRLAETVDRQL